VFRCPASSSLAIAWIAWEDVLAYHQTNTFSSLTAFIHFTQPLISPNPRLLTLLCLSPKALFMQNFSSWYEHSQDPKFQL
jgi:hypothetical protein